jgi:hypothetical protein
MALALGQDALIVCVETDARIRGTGEMDSNPWLPRALWKALLAHYGVRSGAGGDG